MTMENINEEPNAVNTENGTENNNEQINCAEHENEVEQEAQENKDDTIKRLKEGTEQVKSTIDSVKDSTENVSGAASNVAGVIKKTAKIAGGLKITLIVAACVVGIPPASTILISN